MRLLTLMTAAVLAVSMLAGPMTASANGYGKQKVVYHINYPGGDDDKAYRAAMRNVQNHINAVGAENLEIKVVLHGNGVYLLRDAKTNDKLQMDVTSLKSQNVKFNICANTLKGKKIDYEKDLFEVWQEDIVPSGVAELAHLQMQGYAYIKP